MLDDVRGFLMMVCYSLVDTRVARAVLGSSIIIVISIVSLRLFGGYINSPRPTIYITSPSLDSQILDKKILVKGRVIPAESQVTVNGDKVESNGDGTFSQIVNLSAGINVLKFEAVHYGKKSGVIQTATRVLTDEEKAEQTAALLKEQAKVNESATQIAQVQATPDVLGAQAPSADPTPATSSSTLENSLESFRLPSPGMIVTKTETPSGNDIIISGIFKNTTEKTLRWLKIKGEYKDSSGKLLDSKIGAITKIDQHLAPGAQVEYAIPSSSVPYKTCEISVAYEAL